MSETIGIVDILKILPHRYPLLLVDRIIEYEKETRIVGLKNLTATEPVFQGHFPGNPVMPGVFQLEAMAQCGGILLNKASGSAGAIAYFTAVDGARFRRVCRPGDQLRIEVSVLRIRAKMVKVAGRITVDGELASEAELMFAYGI